MHTQTHAYTYTFWNEICVYTYDGTPYSIYLFLFIYIHIHIYIHTHIYIYTYIYIFLYVYILWHRGLRFHTRGSVAFRVPY